MKPIGSTLIWSLLLFASPLFAQETTVNEEMDIIFWQDTTGGLNNNIIKDVAYDEDLNLHLLINAEDGYGSRRARMAKLDQDGNLVYSHLLTAGGNAGLNMSIYDLKSIYQTSEGGWKISGTSFNSSNMAMPYAESVNEEGEVNSFSYTIAFSAIYGGDNLILDDTTVLAGTTMISRSGSVNMWLAAQSRERSPNNYWNKKIASEYPEYNVSLAADAEGNFYVLGYRYLDAQFSYYSPILYKTDARGEVLWSKFLENELNPYYLEMDVNSQGQVLVSNGYGTEATMESYTELYVYSSEGDSIAHKKIDGIRAAGVLCLSTGNTMLYGSNLKTSGSGTAQDARIAKAKTMVLNQELITLNYDEMCEWDNPDYIMPSMQLIKPTSSDFTEAVELPNGRIACVGRVYMPENITAGAILVSPSTNRPLVVYTDPLGGFGNQLEKKY